MEREQVEILAGVAKRCLLAEEGDGPGHANVTDALFFIGRAIGGLAEEVHKLAEAVEGAGCRLAEDMPLAEYVYNGLEKAARIIKGLDE